MIITRTPYRVSLFGGGTDYPHWYNAHGGSVLVGAIDRYCWISARRPPGFGCNYKVVYSKVEECNHLDEIGHAAVRESLRFLEVQSCEIVHWSDLPARSGVGSSSAFVVGLLLALHKLRGESEIDPYDLAVEATFVEQKLLKETVGDQDQIAAAFGGLARIKFRRDGDYDRIRIDDNLALEALQKHLMLVYTGIQRTSSDVAKQYVHKFEEIPAVLKRTKELAKLGTEAVKRRDMKEVGKLLDESWWLKRSVDPALIASPDIDSIYERARFAGAWGGKVLGAGGGGCMLFLAPPEKHQAIRESIKGMVHFAYTAGVGTDIKFDHEGAKVTYDSRGAGEESL